MTDTQTLTVPLGERSYQLVIGQDLLDQADELIAPDLRLPEVVVVTDTNLAATRHPERLARALARAGIRERRIVVPAGEASKSLRQLDELLETILAGGAERKLTLIALGGGVIGDLAGFAAAVLLRGVDLIQIPTTLLAQVDSSVGGKTGVNSRFGKNLIGAFHQPRSVIIDVSVLDDLPARELRAGYAELVKHAFIRDRRLFDWLEPRGSALLSGSDAGLRVEAIRRSVAIKAAIVAADERETQGERALLNFGHTFAHAYETLTGYGRDLLHGEAVGLGMAQAFALSRRLGHCPAEDTVRAIEHLQSVGLPILTAAVRPQGFAVDEVLDVMRRDKKVDAGRLTFVLSQGLGAAFVSRDVPQAELEALLRDEI